jgi:hypothetical protein
VRHIAARGRCWGRCWCGRGTKVSFDDEREGGNKRRVCTDLSRRVTGRSSSIPTVSLNDDMKSESQLTSHPGGRAAAFYSKARVHDKLKGMEASCLLMSIRAPATWPRSAWSAPSPLLCPHRGVCRNQSQGPAANRLNCPWVNILYLTPGSLLFHWFVLSFVLKCKPNCANASCT